MAGIPAFYFNFSFDITAISKLNFLKPTSFSFGYDYHASARMIASRLNLSPNYFIAEAPSNPLLILSFKNNDCKNWEIYENFQELSMYGYWI